MGAYSKSGSSRINGILKPGDVPPMGGLYLLDVVPDGEVRFGFANINAKAEGIDTKSAFREAFARRRCLVPFDCFYEWKKLGKERQPYAVALADRRLMALAGL